MSWFAPHSFDYTHMERKLEASSTAHQIAQQRILERENQIRDDLKALELNYIAIRYLSNQSNVKGHIIKKQYHALGWVPHEDTYQLLQNSS